MQDFTLINQIKSYKSRKYQDNQKDLSLKGISVKKLLINFLKVAL